MLKTVVGTAAVQSPDDITLPRSGSTTARSVLSRAIGRLLSDLRLVLGRPTADPVLRRAVGSLAAALSATPDRQAALTSALRRPNVSALLRCARGDADPRLVVELVATLAVELAVLGALRAVVRIDQPPARVVSLSGRFVVELADATALLVGPDFLEIERPTGRDRTALPPTGAFVRTPFHPIRGSIVLALEDNNPLSMYEAHPKKAGNRIDLGGQPESAWCDSLGDALDRIERYLPELRAEHDLFVQQFVPVGYDAEAHLSASYREAIGTIYLTLHPQAMTMTEAVVHEFSHNKINALFEIDDVLHNAYSPLYKSPVRPDPRPLHGILLAVHAFVPVARLYEAMLAADDPLTRHPSFRGRFAQIVEGNREGTAVLLEHAQPTAIGRGVLDELARWDAHFR